MNILRVWASRMRNIVFIILLTWIGFKFWSWLKIPLPNWEDGWWNIDVFPGLNVGIVLLVSLWILLFFAINLGICYLIGRDNVVSKDHPLTSFEKVTGALLTLGLYGLWVYLGMLCVPYLLMGLMPGYPLEFWRLVSAFPLFPIITCSLYFPIQKQYPETYGAKAAITCITIVGVVVTGMSFYTYMMSPRLFDKGKSIIFYDDAALSRGNKNFVVMHLPDVRAGETPLSREEANPLTRLTKNSDDSVKRAVYNKVREDLKKLWPFGKKSTPSKSLLGGLFYKERGPQWTSGKRISIEPGGVFQYPHLFQPGDKVRFYVRSGEVKKINRGPNHTPVKANETWILDVEDSDVTITVEETTNVGSAEVVFYHLSQG